MQNIFTFTATGLAYDGFGVMILGYAFFSTPISSIFLNSQVFYGGNSGVLESGVETRTNGITGTFLLVVGFFLQWLGAINLNHETICILLVSLLIIFIILYFLFLRKYFINYQIKKAKEFEEKWKSEKL